MPGVRFFDDDGIRRTVRAPATLLATGGAGQVFRETTNPAVATGDGIALAYRCRRARRRSRVRAVSSDRAQQAGRAALPDFRGAARRRRAPGQRRRRAVHGPLSPGRRSRAARRRRARASCARPSETGGPVFLTLAHLDAAHVRRRFPTIAAMCRQVGLDIATDPIPVGPAAHYLMGGIDTDEWGRTSLPGLFAAGETACTGVHGANRLASNSLLEGLVFGARAATAMQQPPRAAELKADRVARPVPERAGAPPRRARRWTPTRIRDLMWRAAGLFRTPRTACRRAVADLDARVRRPRCGRARRAPTPSRWRRFNLLTVARLIARAALRREESRGGHFREDFPARDDLHWKVHLRSTRSRSRTDPTHCADHAKNDKPTRSSPKSRPAPGLLPVVPRRRPPRGARRLLARQGLHGHPAVRLRDLGADSAGARSPSSSGPVTSTRTFRCSSPRAC